MRNGTAEGTKISWLSTLIDNNKNSLPQIAGGVGGFLLGGPAGAALGSSLGRATMPGATLGTVAGAGLNGYTAGQIPGAVSSLGSLLSRGGASAASGSAIPDTALTATRTLSNPALSSTDAGWAIPDSALTATKTMTLPGASSVEPMAGRVPFGFGNGVGLEADGSESAMGGLGAGPNAPSVVESTAPGTMAPTARLGRPLLSPNAPSVVESTVPGLPIAPTARLGMPNIQAPQSSFLSRLADKGGDVLSWSEKHDKATGAALNALGSNFGAQGDLTREQARALKQQTDLAAQRDAALEPLRRLLGQQIPGTFQGVAPVPTANPYIRR